MESDTKEVFLKYSPSDPELIDKIVNKIKSKGIFDQFRKECLADVDTKPAYQNLQRRVNGTVNGFLASQKWPCAVNKTQLRESLRKHTVQQSFLEVGVDRIVDQVVMPKIYSVFHPKVEEIVYELLGLEKPKPKPQTPPKPKPEPLLELKPKPQSLLDLKLDFHNFRRSFNEPVTPEKKRAGNQDGPSPLASKLNEEPPCPVKVEEDNQLERQDGANTPPPLEPNGDTESDVHPEPVVSSPISRSVPPELNNDDDSNTIDEMPLLAASMDTNSNGNTTPVFNSSRNDSIPKAESSSDSDSLSLPSSQPRMELDSSTNNLSSLKSECKETPLKKFDNFSNLGEKLKQSDVNLRESTPVKPEEITEESSELTKSSEHDSESIELNMEVHSDSNTSAMDSSRLVSVKNEIRTPPHYSDDSDSSVTTKSKSQDSKNEVKSESKSRSGFEEPAIVKTEKEESPEVEKEHDKSKQDDTKSRHRDRSKEKSRSHRHRDDKPQKSKESHSSERNGKHDSEKRDEKKDKGVYGNEKNSNHRSDSKTAAVDEDKKKKKDEKWHHHSREHKDSKSEKKLDGHREKEKDNFKTPEKEKKKKDEDGSRRDRHKSKSESSSRSNHSRSGERKSRDEKKKDDKKEDDRKKDSRKRKSGKCDEDDLKNKNSRRSSDRDSNGNAGGGSEKSKSTGSFQSHKKTSKSEQKTRSRYKDPSNSDAVDIEDALQVTDEVDLILLQINNSIENEQNRLDVREILNEPGVAQTKKPKIAKNFHEIKKIMQARKNIDKLIVADAVVPSTADVSSEEECVNAGDDLNEASVVDDYSADNIQLKEVSVVLSDVIKESSSLVCLKNIDYGSIYLGSNNEIVGVEKRDVGSSCQDSTLSDIPPGSQEADNLENVQNFGAFLDSNISSGEHAEAEGPISPSVGSPANVTPVVDDKTLTKDDVDDDNSDEMSIISGRSDSTSNADGVDPSDSDSKRSNKSEKTVKKKVPDLPLLPSRSTSRKNAGSRMYAILGEVSSSKHSNAPAGQGPKNRTHKSRRNSDVEKLGGSNSSKVNSESTATGERPLNEEVPRTSDRADDGSDVSNKENDETSVPESSRPKTQNSDASTLIETRASRRRNPGVDKPEENSNIVKSSDGGKSNSPKTRGPLPCKNMVNEPESTKDDSSGKLCTEVPTKVCARRSAVSLLASKIKDSDDPWNIKANSSSSSSRSESTDSFSVLDKFKSTDVRKSMECLQMEKENLTVLQMSSNQSSESPPSTIPSPRRKSCPDILHPREYCENKDPTRVCDATVRDGVPHSPIVSGADEKPNDSSTLSKNAVLPQKKREYHTRNANTRRKSISTAKQTGSDTMKHSSESVPVDEQSSALTSFPVTPNVQSGLGSEPSFQSSSNESAVAISEDKPSQRESSKELSAPEPPDVNEKIRTPLPMRKVSLARPSTRSTKGNNGKLTPPSALPEDSASCSSSEFRGFSEEDGEPDSEEECLGFTDLEIRKAVAQLRQLTHFVANCRSLNGSVIQEAEETPVPHSKKTRASLDDALEMEGLATAETPSKTKKRKLSLSFSPDKDKKEALIGQCKAESKDSGLCESPEQQPATVHQKSVSVGRRTPAGRGTSTESINGIRTNPVRTSASRPERNASTETSTKIDATKNSRNSQRYCASDLYKPRPSFARDVRAVKRTASPEISALGRAKKRSR